MDELTMPLAFAAGVLSFLSPCVMPLIPSYVTFITGMSFEELTGQAGQAGQAGQLNRKKVRNLTMINSLIFIGGFSTIFVLLGAGSSLLGEALLDYQEALRIGGGVLVIIFGLFISGIIRLDFLMKEKKFHMKGRPAGYFGTFLIGMTFAAGWTPCIGPILGSILLVASSEGSTIYGIKLLMVYSAGLGVPFFISALAFNSFLSYSKSLNRHMKKIMLASGLVLIAFGILLLTDNIRYLTGLFPDLGINF